MTKRVRYLALGIFAAILFILAAYLVIPSAPDIPNSPQTQQILDDLASIPDFSGEPYAVIGDNTPDFQPEDLITDSYESYSPLDALNRCGIAMACIGTDIMPTEERGSIGQVKPSGWQTVKYDQDRKSVV